jgi:hypothetical protein
MGVKEFYLLGVLLSNSWHELIRIDAHLALNHP